MNDPVNGFDLDGNWGWGDVFNVAKAVVRTVTKVAEVASFIPGPIGMVASGVAVAGNLAQGNYAGAAASLAGFIPGGKLISKMASMSKVGSKLLSKTLSWQAKSRFIGRKSFFFGSTAYSKCQGVLNRQGGMDESRMEQRLW